MSEEEKPVNVVTLCKPLQIGSETVDELVLNPTPRAYKDFSLPMSGEGMILFQPYTLAKIGLIMAGKPSALVDKLDVKDMNALALKVMDFFG